MRVVFPAGIKGAGGWGCSPRGPLASLRRARAGGAGNLERIPGRAAAAAAAARGCACEQTSGRAGECAGYWQRRSGGWAAPTP